MTARPSGTVTFLFSDIEGSTGSWEQHPAQMARALERHDEILRLGIANHNGVVILERGEGDSFFGVFTKATEAVVAACEIQRVLQTERWPTDLAIRVRIAIHTGDADLSYRGRHVNRAARIRAIAHGEQVLISGITEAIVRGELTEEISLIDLGWHRLRDVRDKEHVFQLAHANLRRDFPPLKSLSNFYHNLPLQLTSFVGHEDTRLAVSSLIAKHRLVTLTGAGGCGKTRLAIQIGADEIERFPGGVCFVDLAPVAHPDLVLSEIAVAIGAQVPSDLAARDVLLRALEGTNTLVILDNCEHVASACAAAAEVLLRAGDNIHILATSREPLGLQGEFSSRVRSLSIPDDSMTTSEIDACEAVQLFAERAAAARPEFAVTENNAGSIGQICRILEGIPLAIELAAAHVKALGVRDIQHRLSSCFALLTGGRGRHRTLHAAIDWSYNWLSEEERSRFRQLSVFVGGFDLPAVEAVWKVSDALAWIEDLVDKSLVAVEPSDDDSMRYRLLETLRQYGREKLIEAGEENDVCGSHAAHFLAVAEDAYKQRIEHESICLGRLARDHDDFRAALTWLRTRPVDLLRLASVLGWFWHARSHYCEGKKWLEEALQTPDHFLARARALWALSMILIWQGHAEDARPLGQECIELYRKTDDQFELALALESVGWSYFMANNYTEALKFMEKCLEKCSQLNSAKMILRGRVNYCQVLVAIGDVTRAEPLARDILAAANVEAASRFQHYALHFLGDCGLWRGDSGAAASFYAKSLRAALDCGAGGYSDTTARKAITSLASATGGAGSRCSVCLIMQGMAMALVHLGHEREGFRLLGATRALLKQLESSLADEMAFWVNLKKRYLEPARLRFGEDLANKAEQEGRIMGWNRVLEYALNVAKAASY